MTGALPFLLRCVGLRRLLMDPVRTALLLLSVAIASSVFIAILHAAQSSIASLEGAVSSAKGIAQIRSLRGVIELSDLAGVARYLPQPITLVPLIEERATYKEEGVLLLALDAFALGASFIDRKKDPTAGSPFQACHTEILAPDSPQDLELRVNEDIFVFRSSGVCHLPSGLLLPERAVLVDIGAFSRGPHVRTVNSALLLTDSEEDLRKTQEIVQTYDPLGAQLVVQTSEDKRAQAGKVLGAFRVNIFVIVVLTFLVCGFAVFNAVHLAVRSLEPEFSALRTIGISRNQILLVVLFEAFTLGIVGALLGLSAGAPLSSLLQQVFTGTARELYNAAPDYFLRPRLLLYAISVAVTSLVTVAGALYPAYRAARTLPGLALRETEEVEPLRFATLFFVAVLLCIVSLITAVLSFRYQQISLAHIAALAVMLTVAVLAPVSLWFVTLIFHPLCRRLNSVAGLVATSSIISSVRAASLSAAANAVGVSLLVALSVMVASFRTELERWVGYSIQADLFVRVLHASGTPPSSLPADLLKQVESAPEVERLVRVAETEATITRAGGESLGIVRVQGSEFTTLPVRHRRFEFLRGALDDMALKEGRQVLASESAASKLSLTTGEEVILAGKRYTVGGVYREYSSERPILQMDFQEFQRRFSRPVVPTAGIFLKAGVDSERFTQNYLDYPGVSVTTNSQLRTSILNLFDRTFLITDLMRALVALLCGIGFVLVILQLVWERRRELRTLQIIGLSKGLLQRCLLWEGSLILIAALVPGLFGGLALGAVLVLVLNPVAFGWSFPLQFSVSHLLSPVLLLLLCNLLPGVFILGRAYRVVRGATVADE